MLIKLIIILIAFIAEIRSLFITVDAQDEECFFEDMQKSMKLALIFEIKDGGFLDIDVRITDPDQQIIHMVERQSNGHYALAADRDGRYTYCFVNKMSTLTPKKVKFNVDVIPPDSDDQNQYGAMFPDNKTDSEILQKLIKELQNKLNMVYQEQEYMDVRDRIHRSINENTNSRVVIWSFFEAFILFFMAVGQVYYLKKFFEVRRVV